MRSFEQRIAEIDRRSNKIFQKRKKLRKQLLTFCVPVVLCAGLCLLLAPSDTVPSDSTNLPAAGSLQGHKSESGIISPISQIEITFNESTSVCTDHTVIQNIHTLLLSYTADIERGSGGTYGAQETVKTYTITLTTHSGETTRYILSGTTLTAAKTNQLYPLTPEQAQALQKLLETPNS